MKPVIALDQCHRGGGTFVEIDDRELAVFLDDDGELVVVSDNTCPHSSGNLSAGEVAGACIVCPLHQWEFDIKTGLCTDSPKARVKIYQAEVRDGSVWVAV
ncbi:MAG: Rieske (2Fe-2S) protein [Phycisphaerae bacterium]